MVIYPHCMAAVIPSVWRKCDANLLRSGEIGIDVDDQWVVRG